MKVQNMTSSRGKKVPNQVIITDHGRGALGNFDVRETFQSYDTVIAVRTVWPDETRIELDRKAWNYSVTTSQYRNQFLGMNSGEVKRAIAGGEFVLTDLN